MTDPVAYPMRELAYPEHYASAIRWANNRYPQLKFVQPLVGSAAVLREVMVDGGAWARFMQAEPSDEQLRKMGVAAEIAHRRRNIKVDYRPEEPTAYNLLKPGLSVLHFDDDFLSGLMNGARLRISEVAGIYADRFREQLGTTPDLAGELLSGKHPDLVAPLHLLMEASSSALHSDEALAVGTKLENDLAALDPQDPGYSDGRYVATATATGALKQLLVPAMTKAADPSVFDPWLLHKIMIQTRVM